MRKLRTLVLLLACVILTFSCDTRSVSASLFACPEGTDIVMPVGVVVLQGTSINGVRSDSEPSRDQISIFIEQAIDEAEQILSPVGVCLNHEGTWFEPVELEAPTGRVDPDGSLEIATANIDFQVEFDEGTHNEIDGRVERSQISTRATALADNPPPFPLTQFWPAPGRGYVIVFANFLYKVPAASGFGIVYGKSGSDDYTTPVNDIQAAETTTVGQVGIHIAHEFAHLFSGRGHHPDPSNILYEFGGTEFEEDHIAAIREGA